MGDFTGFTFNGVHSSEFGITRISGGDRYNEGLSPEIKDINVEIPGMDGEYYFGSQFGTRPFSIEIAYDSMTETQFRKISRFFHQKTIGELIFDERPYKKYLVKIESPIELSYVCFDEPDYEWRTDSTTTGVMGQPYEYKEYTGTNKRTYKGEGSISFIGYYPFAKSAIKELTSEQVDSDWAISSGILSVNEKNRFYIDKIITERTEIEDTELVYEVPDGASCIIPLYNPGDLHTGFVLYVPYADGVNTYQVELALSDGLGSLSTSEFTINIENTSNEIGFIVNSVNGLIEGVNSFNEGEWTTSGKIYNKYINNGTFFKIPITEEISDTELPLTLIIKIVGQAPSELEIAYYYLYL